MGRQDTNPIPMDTEANNAVFDLQRLGPTTGQQEPDCGLTLTCRGILSHINLAIGACILEMALPDVQEIDPESGICV